MTSAPSCARARETRTCSAVVGCSDCSSGDSPSTSRAVLQPVRRSPASGASSPRSRRPWRADIAQQAEAGHAPGAARTPGLSSIAGEEVDVRRVDVERRSCPRAGLDTKRSVVQQKTHSLPYRVDAGTDRAGHSVGCRGHVKVGPWRLMRSPARRTLFVSRAMLRPWVHEQGPAVQDTGGEQGPHQGGTFR